MGLEGAAMCEKHRKPYPPLRRAVNRSKKAQRRHGILITMNRNYQFHFMRHIVPVLHKPGLQFACRAFCLRAAVRPHTVLSSLTHTNDTKGWTPMKTINLRDYYPYYTRDTFVDLPDEVIAV